VVAAKPKIPARSVPDHVVVDGSNLATEGRSAPSLKQLNEAVLAFMKEYPKTQITVVVDASSAIASTRKKQPSFLKPSPTANSSHHRRVRWAGATASS